MGGAYKDRAYLRSSACHRCMKRYGASKEWAVSRMTEVGIDGQLASAVVDGWLSNYWMRQARKHRRVHLTKDAQPPASETAIGQKERLT